MSRSVIVIAPLARVDAAREAMLEADLVPFPPEELLALYKRNPKAQPTHAAFHITADDSQVAAYEAIPGVTVHSEESQGHSRGHEAAARAFAAENLTPTTD